MGLETADQSLEKLIIVADITIDTVAFSPHKFPSGLLIASHVDLRLPLNLKLMSSKDIRVYTTLDHLFSVECFILRELENKKKQKTRIVPCLSRGNYSSSLTPLRQILRMDNVSAIFDIGSPSTSNRSALAPTMILPRSLKPNHFAVKLVAALKASAGVNPALTSSSIHDAH